MIATAQSLLVDDLKRDGVASCAPGVFSDLFPVDLPRLTQIARRFAFSPEVKLATLKFRQGIKRNTLKQWLVKHQDQQAFTPDDPLYRIGISEFVLSVCSEAFGEPARMCGADLLYVIEGSEGKERTWAQTWHRDPEDERTIKVALYFNPVDSEAGPFQYVIGSHVGKYAEICPPRLYPRKDIDPLIDPHDKRTFEVAAGTVVFAQTNGLHRGGYTRSKPRLSAMWAYVPDRSEMANRYEVIHDV